MKTSSLKLCVLFLMTFFGFCFSANAAGVTPVTISGVPDYYWYNGCVPTSVGMIMGYWDMNGYPNLFTAQGSAVYTQTNVDNQICSPTYMANNYSLVPPYTSIAEFCKTSSGGATTGTNSMALD